MSTLKEKYLADDNWDRTSGIEEWANAQLDAANERIGELEAKLSIYASAAEKTHYRLTAEREVSDKLEKALAKLIDRDITYIGGLATFSCGEIETARITLAEVAAIRAIPITLTNTEGEQDGF